MKNTNKLHLFEGYGVELEYILVDGKSLSVLPVADQILQAQAGELVNEVAVGPLCWSNELALHILELKTNGPVESLTGLADHLQQGVTALNNRLSEQGGRLMPGGMHPWMNPFTETKIWPHGDSTIYSTYDRIFGCKGHGWSNLQSTHLNLPFQGDDEFRRLHAAIRLILPLLPALAASSPIFDGCYSGLLDNRLQAYQLNQLKIASIAGSIIPETCDSRQSYQKDILQPIYQAIAPFDADGTLQHEWLNSRGAIARFERNTIEIRLLDVQECPQADLAIIELICAVVKALVEERWCTLAEQQSWSESTLAKWLHAAIKEGDRTQIHDCEFLSMFGLAGQRATMGDLWRHLAGALRPLMITKPGLPLEVILNKGPLARRIITSTGDTPTRTQLAQTYGRLCECLANGEMFHA